MHQYELRIVDFMQKVATQSVVISDDLLKPAVDSIEHFMRKMYEEDPNREFKLRLSGITRPLCQQQMAKAKTEAMQDEWNNPLRMFFGGVIEATAVCILKAAGINIEEEQTHVILKIGETEVPGTLDLVIDGEVWDVKSASPYNFAHKFESYASLKNSDDFGYMGQLFGYAKARKLPPGGWIVVDKSSGLIKIIPVPKECIEEDMREQMYIISHNVNALITNQAFKRCYSEVDEKFKKRYTGNRYIESPCTFCSFRYKCWEGLKYLPNVNSEAFDKAYRHYTFIGEKSLDENPIVQGKRQKVTEISSPANLGEILDALGS